MCRHKFLGVVTAILAGFILTFAFTVAIGMREPPPNCPISLVCGAWETLKALSCLCSGFLNFQRR